MTKPKYLEEHGLDHDDGEPIQADARLHVIDYYDLAEYAKAWPDKLISFFVDHLVDDKYQPFVLDFHEYAREADKDGPPFEEWRIS